MYLYIIQIDPLILEYAIVYEWFKCSLYYMSSNRAHGHIYIQHWNIYTRFTPIQQTMISEISIFIMIAYIIKVCNGMCNKWQLMFMC